MTAPARALVVLLAILAAALLAVLAGVMSGPAQAQGGDYPRSEFVWPVSGTGASDSPQTSAFGPRLQANQALMYDFHRGLDIETAAGTPVYAIHAATVHGAGVITGLSSPGVQLRIAEPGRPTLYPTYLHLSRVEVAVGDIVAAGELLGYSGASESGFEHLHFEIRSGGLLQRHAINPVRYLPFTDTANHQVQVGVIQRPADPTRADVVVAVRAPFEELDFEGVSLVLRSQPDLAAGEPSDPGIDNLARWSFDLGALNLAQTPFANGSSDITILDNPMVILDPDGPDGPVQMLITPARFNGKTAPWDVAVYQFTFYNVPIGPAISGELHFGAAVRDVGGNTVAAWHRFPAPSTPIPGTPTPATPTATESCLGQPVTVHLERGELPTAGDDVILGTQGDDAIAAGAGNDIICGLAGNDSIWGQAGDDQISGADGDDRIRGGAGNDELFGGSGVDDINGGQGDDLVRGDDGNDTAVRGGTGDDDVDGGNGNDQLVTGNGGSDVVAGGSGDDKVTGGPRPDIVDGGDGADEVKGHKGADTLRGGNGNDTITGGHQGDAIDGGAGFDTCNGGTTGAPVIESDTTTNCEDITNVP